MTRVADIMTRDVICVRPEDSVTEVISLLMKHQIAGAPVIDAERELTGVISEVDILRRLFPDYSEFISDIEGAMGFDFTDLKLTELCSLKVKDVMRSNPIALAPEESVMKACGMMVSHKIRRLPVVEQDTLRVVGIVSQGQVFHEVLRLAVAKAPCSGP